MGNAHTVETVQDMEHDPQIVWIGEDDRGIELEIIAVVLPDRLLIIHVMQPATGGDVMAKQKKYSIEARTIDLDNEVVHDSQGRRVDAAYVEGAICNVHEHIKSRGGRPALSGTGTKSPQVTFRVPQDVKAAAEARAKREGTTVSALARDAFERYIAS